LLFRYDGATGILTTRRSNRKRAKRLFAISKADGALE
jgi:hypothetical protein